MEKIVYVDNNATTQVDPVVVSAMMPYLKDLYFNPSSMYSPAKKVALAIDNARQTIASIFSVKDKSQFIFTSCATESNNTAIFGVLRATERKHIITSSVEHPAVLEVCKYLQKRGYKVTFLPVDRSGQIDIKDYVKALSKDTAFITIMHANNETGVIFPVENFARIAKETDPEIVFHTDATQSCGKLEIDLESEFKFVDMLSFSGHKLHAPKGVGALFIRKGTRWKPFLLGGHQEHGRRAGTENVPYIVGLAKALERAHEHITAEKHKIRNMRDKLEKALLEKIPYIEVNGKGAPRLPNTLNIAVHYVEGESILYQLDKVGICASSGSACTSGSLEPSHVLKAMNVPFTAIHGSVRFSFSRFNTEEDVDYIIKHFPEIIKKLRKISPYWDDKNNCPSESAMSIAETLN